MSRVVYVAKLPPFVVQGSGHKDGPWDAIQGFITEDDAILHAAYLKREEPWRHFRVINTREEES